MTRFRDVSTGSCNGLGVTISDVRQTKVYEERIEGRLSISKAYKSYLRRWPEKFVCSATSTRDNFVTVQALPF